MRCVIPVLKGGLGNQLFILASAFAFAKRNDMVMMVSILYMETQNVYKHSHLNYFSSIFKDIRVSMGDEQNAMILNDYFQDYLHFDLFYHDIKSLFWLPAIDEDLSKVCFVHFRKTDFLDPDASTIHHVLDANTQYYENCMQHVTLLYPECHFLIFSDDIDLVGQQYSRIFSSYCTTIADKTLNEIETLALMRSCGLGGIAANSTFSWWGLYLNRNRPMMMIPNTFFNPIEMNHNGYYFPECIIKYI